MKTSGILWKRKQCKLAEYCGQDSNGNQRNIEDKKVIKSGGILCKKSNEIQRNV